MLSLLSLGAFRGMFLRTICFRQLYNNLSKHVTMIDGEMIFQGHIKKEVEDILAEAKKDILVQNRTNSNDDLLTPSEEINDKSITLGSKGYILRRFDWGSLIPGRIILTCHHNKGSKHIFPQIHINKDKKAKEAINFVKFQNENFAKMQLSGDFHLVNVMIDIIKTLEETHEVDCSKTFHYSISTAEDCGARIIIMDLRKHKRPHKTWPNETLKILSNRAKLGKKKLIILSNYQNEIHLYDKVLHFSNTYEDLSECIDFELASYRLESINPTVKEFLLKKVLTRDNGSKSQMCSTLTHLIQQPRLNKSIQKSINYISSVYDDSTCSQSFNTRHKILLVHFVKKTYVRDDLFNTYRKEIGKLLGNDQKMTALKVTIIFPYIFKSNEITCHG